jgi:hypothetical protein
LSTREERLLAGRQVFIRAIQAEIAGVDKDARHRLEHLIGVDEKVAAELADGTRIGAVKRTKVSQSARVTDMPALLAWVKEHRPDEVVTTETVSDAFVAWAKSSAKKHGAPVIEATGEVVPGVEIVEGSASYIPELDDAALPMLRARYAELVSKGYLALPGADQDEAAS